MEVMSRQPNPEVGIESPEPVLGPALQPGVVLLGFAGEARRADARALALLGCREAADLTMVWAALVPQLEAAGLWPPNGSGSTALAAAGGAGPASLSTAATTADIELPAAAGPARRLRVSLVSAMAPPDCGDLGPGGALLVQDGDLAAALESDLRAASQMRSLAQIAPAVAHDLRAPINAMVLNLEVLKETLGTSPMVSAASGAGRDPRERQKRYVSVLREELTRLHQSLELFLAHISPRGERAEMLDLRDMARDLGALLRPPARKQQAQVEVLVPDAAVPIFGHRYLLRQALLHLGIAALAPVPRDGTLEIRLDRLPGRCRLRIVPTGLAGARVGEGGGTGPSGAPPAAEPRFTAAGTDARLSVARSILGMFGGTVTLSPTGTIEVPAAGGGTGAGNGGEGAMPRLVSAIEIVFSLSESN